MQLNSVKEIWILDKSTTTPLGVLDNTASEANAYEAVEHRQLNGYSTLDLIAYMEIGAQEFLTEENRLLYKDPYDKWKLFIIKRYKITHSGDGNISNETYAEEASVELLDSVSTAKINIGETLTAEQFLARALAGSNWEIGSVPLTEAKVVPTTYNMASSMEMVVNGAALFGLDIDFEYEVVGNTVTRYIVNYLTPVAFTGKRFSYGLDVEEVSRTSDTTSLFTACCPFGGDLNAGVEGAQPEFLTLDGVVMNPNTTYTCTNPDGTTFEWTTPSTFRLSGFLVYDAISQAAWGYNEGNNFRQVKYKNDKVLDVYYLAYVSWFYLQSFTAPRITYEVSAYNLGALSWFDNQVNYQRVGIGDTVAVLDQVIGIEVYTRVIQLDLDLNNVANSTFTFGMLYQTLADLYLDTNTLLTDISNLQGEMDNIQGEIDKLPDKLNTFNYIKNGRFDDGTASWQSNNLSNTSIQNNIYGPLDSFPITQESDPIINNTDYPLFDFGGWVNSEDLNYTTAQVFTNNLPGSYLRFNFIGTNVSLFTSKTSDSGIIEIYLDNALVSTVDLYNATTIYKQEIYNATNLSNTAHSLMLVIRENSNVSSTDTACYFDSFQVTYLISRISDRVSIPSELGNYLVDGDVIFESAVKISGASGGSDRVLYQEIGNPNAFFARTVTYSAYLYYTNLTGNVYLNIEVDYTDTSSISQVVNYSQAIPTGSSSGWKRFSLTQTISPANLAQIDNIKCSVIWAANSFTTVTYVTGLQLELGSTLSTWKPYTSDLTGSGVWDRIQAIKQQAFRELLGYTYISESNGIWVYDTPTGTGKAVAIKGGMIGLGKFDNYSQSWDFKTFVDGQSVNADVINTGQMLADRIYGGILRLGNIQGRAGYLEIVDSDGTPLVVLSADQSQYQQNRLLANFIFGVDPTGNSPNWYGKPPQNVVGKTSEDITPNQINTTSIGYYVSCSGNDKNSGASYNTALRTINEAINRLPEYLDRSVVINVARGLNYEAYQVSGLLGASNDPGQASVQFNVKGQTPPKTRFIKLWVEANPNGSYSNNVNTSVQLYEIQVFEKRTGTNVALGKTVTLQSGTLSSNSAALSTLTDGYTYYGTGQNYVSFQPPTSSVPICFYVDLGQEYDITGVKVFFWWSSNEGIIRQYRNVIIQGNSSDNNNLYTIVDQRSTAEGTPFYTPTIFSDQYGYYYPTIPQITGATSYGNCLILSGAYDMIFTGNSSLEPLRMHDGHIYRVYSCIMNASRVAKNAFASNFSRVYLDGCEFSNATENGVNIYNTNVTAFTSIGAGTGLVYKNGFLVNAGTYHGNNVTPVATTLLSNVQGSFIGISSFSSKPGTVSDTSNFQDATPPPPPPPPVTTSTTTFSSKGSSQWRHDSSKWNTTESNPAQGTWGYGLRSGYWWFGDQIYDLVNGGATINWIKFTFTRNGDNNGLASAATAQIRTHNYAAQPSTPAFSTSDPTTTASITRGQTVTVTLTSSMVAKFNAKAARGIYLYSTSTAQAYYMKCGTSAKLEVNYTK